MKKIRVLNDKNVYYPCTPTKWTKKPTIEKCLVLTVSAGGGMGGTKWKEIVEYKPLKTIPSNKLFSFIDILTKEEVLINTNYIVEIKVQTFITVSYFTENQHCNPGHNKIYFISNKNINEVCLINRFKSLSDYTKKL